MYRCSLHEVVHPHCIHVHAQLIVSCLYGRNAKMSIAINPPPTTIYSDVRLLIETITRGANYKSHLHLISFSSSSARSDGNGIPELAARSELQLGPSSSDF
ncbi:hypothetical protein BDW75DRAFT_208723 [Aspergillus navahoensis]